MDDSPLTIDYVNFFRNFNVASVSSPSAITHSRVACGHNSLQPAPRKITPRAASIIQVVGSTQEICRKNHGMQAAGKMYPHKKMHGMTVPITICDAASRVVARVEIHSPSARQARANGRAMISRVAKLPWIGT